MAGKKFQSFLIGRIHIAGAIYVLLISVLILRLGYIQILYPEQLTDKATVQQQKDERIIPKRGTITDRNGKILAVSVKTYDLLLEKKFVTDERKNAEILNLILGIDEEAFLEKFADSSERFVIMKGVSQEKADELKASEATGIKYDESAQRIYPFGQFAAHVIGHVSSDNFGLAGVEAYLDKELRGVYGRRIVIKDKINRELPDSEIRYNEPVDGYQVTLTIDEVIQRYVEKVINQALVDYNAVGVTAIVMNPKTGEILAMASKPDYDPSDPRVPLFPEQIKQYENATTDEERSAIISKLWRNPAVNDVYEPGSTFKLITTATALEENLVRADEQFYDSGYIQVNDRTIKNWTSTPYGKVDFRKATVESINTVFVQVGQRIGGTKFLQYIDSFGFGKKTGVEIPGEATGIIYSEKKSQTCRTCDDVLRTGDLGDADTDHNGGVCNRQRRKACEADADQGD